MAQVTNCLIFGSGRCGTSALAGALAHAGAFIGYHIYGPSSQQPHGYYEDWWINQWNDDLIRQSVPPGAYHGLFQDTVPLEALSGQFRDVAAVKRMFWLVPYVLKDPRFAYTYPIWKPLLVEPWVCLVLFRNPSDFVQSALRLRTDHPEISDDSARLLEIWKNSYDHILRNDDGRFYYYEFKQIVSGGALKHIRNLVGYAPELGQVRVGDMHGSDDPCPEALLPLYLELKRRANSE